ncbi:nucleotide exchange factor GrpE [Ectobacillus ponti]|uniref:Protein GrpE n=1 Tax=Ectobacillus ponti TaxID=2961894 RepID=A0AA42BP41_9BACI|nr:nucleotide exchange factor GrpE [Ectobacillus ponti]MCP8967179.1 nucleotide exchange factor GrpE [Ectobacillus ponti]
MEERNEQAVEEQMEAAAEVTEQEAAEETTTEAVDAEHAALEAKLAETENRLLRLQADFDNYRRRAQKEALDAEKYKAQNLATGILPALDNFERALKTEANEANQALLQGMEMVYRQLLEALQQEGVTAIESVGQPFDPYQHQAVMQVSDSNYDSNTVVEEFQKGYKLKDRVIRVAMVKVNE